MATSGVTELGPTIGGGSGGVTSLNSLSGALNLVAGSNITITPSGSNITIASTGGGGSGTVSSVSVVSANGLAGTVATATTTPAITLSTTVTAPVLAANGTAISAATTTGSGSTVVLAISPTLVTPALGTPSALVATNLTGTAAGLTAGTVTTNANLTGDVTSVGNATTLATVNTNTGSFGSSTSIPSFTVNGKGLITAASGNVVIAPAGTLSGTTLNSTVVTSNLTSLGTQSQALNMGSNFINALTDPTTAQQAATKNYVDMAVAGLQPLASVFAATTANIPGTYVNGVAGVGATFTTTSTSTFTVDGTSPAVNSRILIKNQSSGFQNGVYQFTTAPVGGVSGAVLTRTFDYDTASDMNSAGLIPVINGTTNALSSWQQVATITTVGTDSLVFTEFTANPSLYMLKANNLSDVASAITSFNNISPMTTAGDIIYENTTPSAVRLPIGSTGSVLTVSGGLPTWAPLAPISGFTQGSVLFANGSGQISQDNSQFFWDDTNHTLGLGTATPNAASIITGINTTGSAKPIWLQGFGTGSSTGVRGDFARGTIVSPAAAQSGDILNFISGRGYGTSAPAAASTGVIQVVAGETFTNTSNATYIAIKTTPTGSVTSVEAVRVNSTGNVLIGTTSDNGALLEVAGTATFSGTVTNSVAPIFSTLTGILAGNGSSAVTAISTGTTGQVLTSNGASPPTFQAPGSGLNEAAVWARIALGL